MTSREQKKCKFGNDTCDGINGNSGFLCRDCVEDAEWDAEEKQSQTEGREQPTNETNDEDVPSFCVCDYRPRRKCVEHPDAAAPTPVPLEWLTDQGLADLTLYLPTENPTTLTKLLESYSSHVNAALMEKLARYDSQLQASLHAEREDCEKALLALAGVHYCTPAETYGTNSSWAISDLCRAVREFASRISELERERLKVAESLNIHYDADLDAEGSGWEVPMEPEPDYFETLPEACAALFKLLDKGLVELERERDEARSLFINYEHATKIERETVESQLSTTQEALRKLLDAVGWRGSGEKDKDGYYCEHCKAYHEDCTLMVHSEDCPVTQARRGVSPPTKLP